MQHVFYVVETWWPLVSIPERVDKCMCRGIHTLNITKQLETADYMYTKNYVEQFEKSSFNEKDEKDFM